MLLFEQKVKLRASSVGLTAQGRDPFPFLTGTLHRGSCRKQLNDRELIVRI